MPPPELRWPLNYRVLMRGWDFLFFRPGIFQPDQQKSAEWNRGGYLVTGAGHCGACHTPKNLFGADRRGRAFGGGPVGGWFAPRLDSAARSGLKSWSVDDIVEYLASGRNGKSHADGPMAEVVVNSTSQMSDADRPRHRGLSEGSSGGRAGACGRPRRRSERWRRAKRSTTTPASPAMKLTARGAPRIYPPLPGNAMLQSADPSSTLRIILDGAQTVTTPRAPNAGSMPAYAKQLSDQQIADVTNYIRNSWGNAAPLVTRGAGREGAEREYPERISVREPRSASGNLRPVPTPPRNIVSNQEPAAVSDHCLKSNGGTQSWPSNAIRTIPIGPIPPTIPIVSTRRGRASPRRPPRQ